MDVQLTARNADVELGTRAVDVKRPILTFIHSGNIWLLLYARYSAKPVGYGNIQGQITVLVGKTINK